MKIYIKLEDDGDDELLDLVSISSSSSSSSVSDLEIDEGRKKA